jgi:hypothetical protein
MAWARSFSGLNVYRKPQLFIFGNVRNLTGGSGCVGRDGNGTMTRNTTGRGCT